MGWAPPLLTGSAPAEPVSLERAKRHLGIDGTAFDEKVEGLIKSARGHIEARCGILIAKRTVILRGDGFADLAHFGVAPLLSIASIAYVAPGGSSQTVDPAVYEPRLDGLSPRIVPAYGRIWPAKQPGSRITVTAAAGYETVPEELVHAMLLRIGTGFLNLEDLADTGWKHVDSLLANFRRGL